MSTSIPTRKVESDLDVLRHYWKVYGGVRGLLTSWYFYGAFALSVVAFPVWLNPDWWNLPISVLPNMLGFSLAGYAIFLAFGNEGFRKFLVSAKIGESSAFVAVTTSFMHFVVLQIAALLLGLIAKFFSLIVVSLPGCFGLMLQFGQKAFWFGCFLIFIYSLTASLASVIAIFRLVRMFDAYIRMTEGRAVSSDSKT